MDGPWGLGNSTETLARECDDNRVCNEILKSNYLSCLSTDSSEPECLGWQHVDYDEVLALENSNTLTQCIRELCYCSTRAYKDGLTCTDSSDETVRISIVTGTILFCCTALMLYGVYPLLVLKYYGSLNFRAAEQTCFFSCCALVGLATDNAIYLLTLFEPAVVPDDDFYEERVVVGMALLGSCSVAALMRLAVMWIDIGSRADQMNNYVFHMHYYRIGMFVLTPLWVLASAISFYFGRLDLVSFFSIFFAWVIALVLLVGSSKMFYLLRDERTPETCTGRTTVFFWNLCRPGSLNILSLSASQISRHSSSDQFSLENSFYGEGVGFGSGNVSSTEKKIGLKDQGKTDVEDSFSGTPRQATSRTSRRTLPAEDQSVVSYGGLAHDERYSFAEFSKRILTASYRINFIIIVFSGATAGYFWSTSGSDDKEAFEPGRSVRLACSSIVQAAVWAAHLTVFIFFRKSYDARISNARSRYLASQSNAGQRDSIVSIDSYIGGSEVGTADTHLARQLSRTNSSKEPHL